MEVANPPVREPVPGAPVRVPLHRRLSRRAAWLTVDLVATGACLIIFLKAFL
jgi:hypothetical protein